MTKITEIQTFPFVIFEKTLKHNYGFFNASSLMRAPRARTSNHNTMHEIMCTDFMV